MKTKKTKKVLSFILALSMIIPTTGGIPVLADTADISTSSSVTEESVSDQAQVTDTSVDESGDTYSVTILPSEGGQMLTDDGQTEKEYEAGETVTIYSYPDAGYQSSAILIKLSGSEEMVASDDSGSDYFTFTMPQADLDIEGFFTVSEDVNETVIDTQAEGGFSTDSLDSGATGLDEADFASQRLIVMADDPAVVIEGENVISQYDNLYIIQYENAIQAMNAYAYYLGTAAAVEPDMTLGAADETATDAQTEVVVTEDENPFDQLAGSASLPASAARDSRPVIALLDTGASLSDNVISQVSMIGDEMASSAYTHGEEMAAEIVAQNPDAQIISVRVLDDNGKGTISSLIAGIKYAVEQGVDYINLSLYAKYNLAGSVAVAEIQNAINAGVTVIGAAGNSSTYASNFIPGAVTDAYIIGAVNEDGTLVETSNYGPNVDFYAVAETTSNAAAIFTGYISANGLDAVPADGLIYTSPEESNETVKTYHGAAPEDVLAGLDPEYIEYNDDTEGYGNIAELTVKRTYVDKYYITDQTDTISEYFSSLDQEEDNGFLATIASTIPLYDVNELSYYVVGKLNTGNEGIIDVVFAKNNLNGIALNDNYYDAETGLVYIKKADLLTVYENPDNPEEGVILCNDVQAQALIPSDGSIIDQLISEGSLSDKVYTSDEMEVWAAALLQGSNAMEGPTPTSVIPEIVGELKEGDKISFTVDPHNGTPDPSYTYLYTVGTNYASEFYRMLQVGDIAEANRIWNIGQRYNHYAWRDYPGLDGNGHPPYAGYYWNTNEITNIHNSTSQALTNWANAMQSQSLSITMDCTHILEAYAGNTQNTITATVIELGENYAVIAMMADGRINADGDQAMAGIYIVAYEGVTTGYLQIEKQLVGETTGTSGYATSPEGVVFGVYSDEACTNAVGMLTIGADGKSNLIELNAGTYYLVEDSAPSGFVGSSEVIPVTVTTGNTSTNPVIVYAENYPEQEDQIRIQKDDSNYHDGPYDFSDVTFTIKYYDGQYNLGNLPEEATRTWILGLNEDENGGYSTELADANLLEGSDALYKDINGDVIIPIGTVTIEETGNAGEAYDADKYIMTDALGNQVESSVYLSNIVSTGTGIEINGLDNISVVNEVNRGDLRFVKVDAETGNVMGNIPFSITNTDTGESHIIYTDANGVADTSSAQAAHTANTNSNTQTSGSAANGIWFGDMDNIDNSQGALPYGTYEIKELSCASNERKDLVEFTIDVTEDAATVDIGEVDNVSPIVTTTAVNAETGGHTIAANAVTDITETVTLQRFTEGRSYRIVSYLNKVSADGTSEVISSQSWEGAFTPDNTGRMTVTFDFSIDTAGFQAGDKYVLTEEVYYGNHLTAEHMDLNDSAQTITVPQIRTTAISDATEDHVLESAAAGETVIVDTVSYSGLTTGEEYTVRGTLMDKATGEPVLVGGEEVTGETTFTASGTSGTVNVEYTVDTSALDGTTLVVFEEIYQGDSLFAEHKGINDVDQTLYIPEIGTTALDGSTGSHTGVVGENATIVDTVSYENLVPGEEYTVSGVLMNKATGEPLIIDDREVTSETTFTPESASGTVELVYVFDASALEGQSVVVFEDLYHNGIEVTSHADINDEGQTVDYPKIRTTAIDGDTQDHTGTLTETATIIDTVRYENLIPGNEYTISGTLMNKETGEELLVDGEPVTAETTFTPEEASGTVDLVYAFDSSALEGVTVVVFEDLYHNGIEVTTHSDINDEDQSVHYPKIRTLASDVDTGDHVGTVAEGGQITDILTYENLMAGYEYTVEGTLMDPESGEAILDTDGEEITAEATFTPEAADGTIELTYEIDASDLAGQTVVVFERLHHNDVLIASHEDVRDEDQSVHYPFIATHSLSDATESKLVPAEAGTTLTDTVYLENLLPETQYTLKGVLMNKDTGEAMLADGEVITSYVDFTTPAAEDGEGSVTMTVDVPFELDSSLLQGTTVVVFESLYHKDTEITTHEDITDNAQTLYIPAVSTKAIDSDTLTQTGAVSENARITDTLSVTNVLEGEWYYVEGYLVDSSTGEFITDANGEPVTANTTFHADEEWADESQVVEYTHYTESGYITTGLIEGTNPDGTPNAMSGIYRDDGIREETITLMSGTVDVTFELDTTDYANKDLVVYEYLYRTAAPADEGEDTDASTGIVGEDVEVGDAVIVDEGVEIADAYIADEASSADEATDSIGDVTVPEDDLIVPDTPSDEALGEEDTDEAPAELVFLASHEDITDADQTINYPEIGTTATIGNGKEATSNGVVTIDDIVEYKNLVPGEQYTIEGTVMDKATGRALIVNGEEVIATGDFTAEDTDGQVTVRFTFDASGLGDKDLVVFEKLYSFETKAEITSHEDINDEGQTVKLNAPPVVQTNDDGMIAVFGIAAGICAAGAVLTVAIKRKKR